MIAIIIETVNSIIKEAHRMLKIHKIKSVLTRTYVLIGL
jgi:hypothetical protein